MGIFDTLKKHKDNFVKQQQEIGRRNAQSKKERREYEDQLKKAVTQARREAYQKEAINSAKVKAKLDAQRRFNPSPSNSGSGMSADARAIIYGDYGLGGSPAKEKVVQKIVQQRSPKKKKKKGSKTRTVVKYVEKPAPKDAVADLLSRLPQ